MASIWFNLQQETGHSTTKGFNLMPHLRVFCVSDVRWFTLRRRLCSGSTSRDSEFEKLPKQAKERVGVLEGLKVKV